MNRSFVDFTLVQSLTLGLYTVVAMASSEVCTFGRNNSGRLGHGDKEEMSRPTVVNGLPSLLAETLQAELESLDATGAGRAEVAGTEARLRQQW